MSFFDDLKKKALGVAAQANPFDHGATYDTKVNNQAPGYRQAVPLDVQNKLNTAKFGPLAGHPQAAQQFIQNNAPQSFNIRSATLGSIGDTAKSFGVGLGRSGIGFTQGASGLYDLASPGRGTSSFSKHLDQAAKGLDTYAHKNNLNAGYKIGQFAGDAGTFAAGGAIAKGATKVPQIAKFANPVVKTIAPIDRGIGSLAGKVATHGAGGRIASTAIKAIASPKGLAGNAGLTTLYTGQEASKGRDISPVTVAKTAGMNLGFQVGLPVAGKVLKEAPGAFKSVGGEIGHAAAPAAQKTVQTAKAVKYNYDKYDPHVRELDRQYEQLNQGWQTASPQARSQYVQAIAANRQARAELTRRQIGNSLRDVSGQSSPKDSRGNTPPQVPATAPAETAGLSAGAEHNGVASSNGSIAPELLPSAEANVFAKNPINGENVRLSPAPVSVGDVLAGRSTQQNIPTAAELESQVRLDSGKTDAKGSSSPLPVYTTKLVNKRDKAFRSTRSIIERQGEHGKQLAGMLQGARDTQEQYLGQLQKALPTVTKLAHKDANRIRGGGDFENFVNATQGLEKPRNATVAQAIAEWQSVHPGIRDRGVNAGLEIGDLGPQYYPHFIDYQAIFKDTNTYNKAINHLVETGQAADEADAIKKLNFAKDVSRNRAFGNLEASRLIDLPFYDKTPSSLTSYLSGSAKRIAQTETFGKGDENALNLIVKAGKQGYDTEAMKNAYDVAVGAKQYNATASNVSGNIRKYVTTTRLGLGALTNISQNVNTGIVTGHLRTMAAAVKQLDPKTRAFVGDTGVIADAVLNDLKSQTGYSSFSQKVLGKAVNKITAPGFGAVEKMNRSIAATAGRDYALRLAQKGDEKTLRGLGVTGKIEGKTLTEAQQIQAARKVVEKTQFKVDPQDLPGWADSPGGKLVSQFRTFSYKQGGFVSNEIIKPAAHGDLLPLGRFLAALPLGYALYETKRAIAGRPEEENPTKLGLQTAQNVGGFGLVFDLYQSVNPIGSKYLPSDRRNSMVTGAIAGPAAGVFTQGVTGLSDLIQRKNTPTDESRLKGKIALGKTPDTYTDATPAARFAIQQVPVVGTAIKNRLLPFTTESNADAGKPTSGKSISKSSETEKPLTASDRVKLAMNTPEAKQFLSLSSGQQKQLASTDPGARQLYEEKKRIETAFKSPGLHAYGLDEESAKTLDHYARLSEKARTNALDAPANTLAYEKAKLEDDLKSGKINDDQAYKRSRDILKYELASNPELAKSYGVDPAKLPKTAKDLKTFLNSPKGDYALTYAQYNLDKANDKISAQDDFKMQDTLYKKNVYKDFSRDAVDIYGMSETKILAYIKQGNVSPDLLKELRAVDQAAINSGLQKYSKLDGVSGKGTGKGKGKSGSKSSGSGGTKDAVSIAKAMFTRPDTVKLTKYKFGSSKLRSPKKVSTMNRKISLKTK